MTLELVSSNSMVALDDIDGSLFDLVRELGKNAPQYQKLEDNYYGSYSMGRAQIQQLQNETAEIRESYFEFASRKRAKQKKVHARDPNIRKQILSRMLADDPWLRKLDQIREACEDALATDGVLVSVGD